MRGKPGKQLLSVKEGWVEVGNREFIVAFFTVGVGCVRNSRHRFQDSGQDPGLASKIGQFSVSVLCVSCLL